jgi:uncharacterized protein (DUF342 family)
VSTGLSEDNAEGEKESRSPSDVTFSLDENSGEVFAELNPSSSGLVLNVSQLQQLARQSGLDLGLFQADAFQAIEEKASKGELGRLHVGNTKDAQLSVTVAKDGLSATLDLEPACGGAVISGKILETELASKGIVSRCVDKDILKTLLTDLKQNPKIHQRVIAEAIPPQKGADSSFEPLLDHCTEIRPRETNAGAVDQKHIRDFIVVEPGTPLMKRHPPAEGIPGTTVVGAPIPAERGAERKFGKKLEGVRYDPNDPNVLLADIKGLPVFSDDGVLVDPNLILKSIDISTGNVDFDGTITVTGSIQGDFTVKATGDILVKGLVERSALIAGRSIVINGGVLGDTDDHEPSVNSSTRLKAEETISAKFISNAYVEAKGDLQVKEYILNSEIKLQGALKLGQEGGEGRLLGGHVHAERGAIVNVMGSGAYVKTEVSAGCDPGMKEKRAKHMRERARREDECLQLQGILDQIIQSGNVERVGKIALGKGQKIQNTIISLQAKVTTLNQNIAEIESRLNSVADVSVVCAKRIYPGAIIRVDNGLHQSDYLCESETGHLSVGGEPQSNELTPDTNKGSEGK